MKKIYIQLGCFLFTASNIYAQAITEKWVQTYVSADSIQDVSIEVDAHHCVMVLGTSTKAGKKNDVVLLRYSKNGTLLWAAEYDNPFEGNDRAVDLVVDQNCNAYALAESDSAGIIFCTILKFDSSGTKIWEGGYQFPGSSATIPNQMVMDSINNVIITGYRFDPINFQHEAITAKFNALGILLWEKNYNPLSFGSFGRAIVADSAGNIFITGYYRTSNQDNDDDIMVVKYDPSGNIIWSRAYEGSNPYSDFGTDICLDGKGNVYVGGNISNSGTEMDWVILKFSPAGNLIWDKIINGIYNQFDYFRDLLVTGNKIYATGSLDNNGMNFSGTLICIDHNGNLLWKSERDFYGSGKIATGLNGEIYQLNGYHLNNPDYNVTAFDQSGNILWEQTYNGLANSKDAPTSFSVDDENNVYVTGYSVIGGSGKSVTVGIVTIQYGLQQPCNLTADAGHDTIIFAGQSVQIGSAPVPGLTYTWSPATGLSDANVANPVASPTSTIKYTVTVSGPYGCTASDEAIIGLIFNNPDSLIYLADASFPLRISRINNDTVLHVVWWQKNNSLQVEKFILERSINSQAFVPVASTKTDTMIDIITQNNIYPYGRMFYSTESGSPGYFFNDVITDTSGLITLAYRVKVFTSNNKYYSLPRIKSFQGPYFVNPGGICTPSGDLPDGQCLGKETSSELINNGTECCWYHYIPVIACSCDVTTPPTCANPLIDCGENCGCRYDPCCVHPCSERDECTCDSGGEDQYGDPVWNSCGDVVTGDHLYDVIVVEPFTPYVAIAAGNIPLQCGECVSLWASAANATVIWSTGETSNLIIVCPTTTTTYYVNVIANPLDNDITCEVTVPITVYVNLDNSTLAIDAPLAICEGDEALLTVTGGNSNYTYLWSTGETSQSISVTPSQTTTYTVIAGLSGCTKTLSHTITVNPSPEIKKGEINIDYCQASGATASIVVTSGTTPYTYLWNTGATTQTVTGLSSGTYIVTVTDIYGCQDDETTTITVNPLLTVTLNSAPDCQGGKNDGAVTAIVNGGTSPFIYVWNTGATTSSITGLAAGNYSITVTDFNGCKGNAAVVLNENPLPSAPIILGNNNTCTNPATYTIGNPLAGATYQWTALQGTPITTIGNSAIINWNITSPATTGVLTVMVTDVNGCKNSSTITIFPCCNIIIHPATGQPINFNLPPNYDLSNSTGSNSFIYANGNLLINGTFTVSANITFDKCNVFLGPDANIVIAPNASFTCKNGSILRSGCNVMWDGIYISSNTSSLYVNTGTIIQDAKNAVVTKNGGRYNIVNSRFDLNLKNIVQQNDAVFLEIIAGNNFLCSGSLLPFYLGSTLNTAPRTTVGIELTDVPGINVGIAGAGKLNTFDNMDVGIRSIRSNVSVRNDKFKNIKQNAACPALPAPCPVIAAIWATGVPKSILSYSLIVGTTSTSANMNNNFEDCTNGIIAEDNVSVEIRNNNFKNILGGLLIPSNAIKVQRSTAGNMHTISGNSFSKFSTGIWMLQNSRSTVIAANNFNVSIPVTGDDGGVAIKYQSAIPLLLAFPSVIISDNTIVRTRTGIWLTNNLANTYPTVTNNYISYSGSMNGNRIGILIENSEPTVDMNTISASGNPGSADANNLVGIYLKMSPQTIITNNSVNRMGTGILCFGNSDMSTLQCNIMNKCFRGVSLFTAKIGDQGVSNTPSDNQWTNTSSSNVRIFGNLQGTPPFWYYRATPSKFDPTVNFTGGSINPITTTGSYNCSVGCINDPCQQFKLAGGVKEQVQFPMFAEEHKFSEKEHIFRKLREKPALMQLGTADDAVLQQFHDSMLNTNAGKIRIVREHIANNDLALAKQSNDLIVSTNIMEENHKKVNDVYLRTWAENVYDFAPADRSTLESVAYQTSIEGGRAVFTARVMLDTLIDDPLIESSARMANTETMENEPVQIFLNEHSYVSKIYPNPNNGLMQLEYTLEDEQTGELEIWDVAGKILQRYSLNQKKKYLEINAPALTSGIYFYKIKINNETIVNDKLIIIK